MPCFHVQLARLVRQTADVYVEAPSREALESRLGEVYAQFDKDDAWEDDNEWGCEEGTHTIVDEIGAAPDIILGAEE